MVRSQSSSRLDFATLPLEAVGATGVLAIITITTLGHHCRRDSLLDRPRSATKPSAERLT